MIKIIILLTILFSINLCASEISKYFAYEKENVKLEAIRDIILIEKKVNGDKSDYGTPIAWAVYYNKPLIVKYLLSINADINLQAKFEDADIQNQMKMIGTPLHVACIKGDYNLTKILLKAGADPYILNPYGADSFKLAKDENIKTLLDQHKVAGKLSTLETRARLNKELNDPIKYHFDFKYYRNIDKAKVEAKKVNKPILLILMSNSCRACNRYARTTLVDKKIVKLLKDNFIVTMLKSSNGIPSEYKTSGTPTTWFLDKNGIARFKPILGSISTDKLIQGLKLTITNSN